MAFSEANNANFSEGESPTVIILSFFSIYVQLKSSFSGEKNIINKIWNILYEKSYQSLIWQSIKEKFHHWQKLELCKIIDIAKLHS